MSEVKYVGPYSPAVYRAAGQIKSGNVNQSYSAPVWQAAQTVARTSSQQQGAKTSSTPTNNTSRYDELRAIAEAGDLNPAQQTEWNNMQQSAEPDWNAMVDEIYNNANKDLDEAARNLETGTNENINLVTKDYDTNVKNTETNRQQLLGDVQASEGKYNKVLDSAVEQAIRDYNALQQQGRSRFGGGSSAGRAVGELAQMEYFRNQGKISDKRAEGTKDFAGERNKIAIYVSQKLDDLEMRKQAALQQLRQQLREGLQQIQSQRTQLAGNRSRERMAFMQDTVNRARAIQDTNMQMRQQIGLAAISQMQEIEGRAFTPAEIKAVMSQFGINLNVGSSAPQQQTTGIAYNPFYNNDEENF
jgi:hypothetical protein